MKSYCNLTLKLVVFLLVLSVAQVQAQEPIDVYAVWYPVLLPDSSTAAKAESGATVGGTLAIRIVIKDDSCLGAGVSSCVLSTECPGVPSVELVPNALFFSTDEARPEYGDPTDLPPTSFLQGCGYPSLAPHNVKHTFDITVNYLIPNPSPFDPPINITTHVNFELNMKNLVVKDSTGCIERKFVPDGNNSLNFACALQHEQTGNCKITYEIFEVSDNKTPVHSRSFPPTIPSDDFETRPGSHSWNWDGNINGLLAPPGLYTCQITATSFPSGLIDSDTSRSTYLFIDRALDDQGNPITDAEYDGYDDNGTPDDSGDDNYLYYIRSYVLRDLGNKYAKEGKIILYDPDLDQIGEWDVSTLPCRLHGDSTDGLHANSTGIKHELKIKVPINTMEKLGNYRFVIRAKDDHALQYRDHEENPTGAEKWALELNQTVNNLVGVSFYVGGGIATPRGLDSSWRKINHRSVLVGGGWRVIRDGMTFYDGKFHKVTNVAVDQPKEWVWNSLWCGDFYQSSSQSYIRRSPPIWVFFAHGARGGNAMQCQKGQFLKGIAPTPKESNSLYISDFYPGVLSCIQLSVLAGCDTSGVLPQQMITKGSQVVLACKRLVDQRVISSWFEKFFSSLCYTAANGVGCVDLNPNTILSVAENTQKEVLDKVNETNFGKTKDSTYEGFLEYYSQAYPNGKIIVYSEPY